MKLVIRVSIAFAFLFVALPAFAQTTPPPLPNPVIFLAGMEYVTIAGQNVIRYKYTVFNKELYPNTMFAAAPNLPPCGLNTSSARTWVDLYDQGGHRLYGFCALSNSSQLDGVYFTLPESQVPPSWIYIELTDRQTGTKYKSNLAETLL